MTVEKAPCLVFIFRIFLCLSPHSLLTGCVFSAHVFVAGQKQQVDPELFRVFYTFWKETEAEAQDVDLPTEVIDHLDNNECVYKQSSCVKTSCGVGIIAMTQKRLFLLPQGRPGFLEITKFRDIQVKGL